MKIKYLSIVLLTLSLLTGCANKNSKEISTEDLQKIKYELIKKQTLNGAISYSIALINSSDFVIKQNNVFISYPIKIKEGIYKGNDYKVEALGNKLDIQPGEKITLNVFMSFEGIGDKSLLGIENPSIQITGYLGNMDNKHKFTIGGDLIKK